MKNKKWLVLLLSLVCTIGLFTGCRDDETSIPKKENTNINTNDDDEWTQNY